MARVYATRAELVTYAAQYGSTYTIPADPEATALLTLASADVERMVTQPYETNSSTLLPTDADVIAAMRDATCALVLQHLDSSSGDGYTTVSIGSATLVGGGTVSTSNTSLGPDPVRHLAAAGLVRSGVSTYGGYYW